jgi:quercetin dioxygenase-like cupin family protein
MTSHEQAHMTRDDSAGASWPAELDALVAAPAHHTLLFENEFVRVRDTCIRAGDRTPIHTHRWPAALYQRIGLSALPS